MRLSILCVLFLFVSTLFGQTAILRDASGQEVPLEISEYEVRSGQLTLFDAGGEKLLFPSPEGKSIAVNDKLRFTYFNYFADKPAKAGFYQQLNTGALIAFDLGNDGLLVKEVETGELLLIPLNRNSPELTYLLRKCTAITAETLEKVNTNGLSNILKQIDAYNRCIDPGSAGLLYRQEVYKTKLHVGPLLGAQSSQLNALNRENTLREAEGSYFGPVLGLEVRKRLGRSAVGLRGQVLIRQLTRSNDSLPIAFNSGTFERYELKSLDLQVNLLGAFHLRREGFLTALVGGISPRMNLSYEFSREVFGAVVLTNEYVDREKFGVGIVGGVEVYKKTLSSGGLLSLQLQADSYKQYLCFSDDTEPGYREVKWSILAGYLF